MEKEYEKYVHNICTLIMNRKFIRAITIINYIFSQGVKTPELVVMLSYATKMVNGIDKAIQVLQQHNMESPLIQYVKWQYRKQIGDYRKVKNNIQNIINRDIKGQVEVCKSVRILSDKNGNQKPVNYGIENHQNYKQINRSNEITQMVRNRQIDQQLAKQLYLRILQDSECIENQLKQQIIKNIQCLK